MGTEWGGCSDQLTRAGRSLREAPQTCGAILMALRREFCAAPGRAADRKSIDTEHSAWHAARGGHCPPDGHCTGQNGAWRLPCQVFRELTGALLQWAPQPPGTGPLWHDLIPGPSTAPGRGPCGTRVSVHNPHPAPVPAVGCPVLYGPKPDNQPLCLQRGERSLAVHRWHMRPGPAPRSPRHQPLMCPPRGQARGQEHHPAVTPSLTRRSFCL